MTDANQLISNTVDPQQLSKKLVVNGEVSASFMAKRLVQND